MEIDNNCWLPLDELNSTAVHVPLLKIDTRCCSPQADLTFSILKIELRIETLNYDPIFGLFRFSFRLIC